MKMSLTTIPLTIAASLLVSTVQAKEIPSCWDTDAVVPGIHTLVVKNSDVTDQELLRLIRYLSLTEAGGKIFKSSYPLFNSENTVFSLGLWIKKIPEKSEELEILKQKVNVALQELLELHPLVQIECVQRRTPHPSVTGSSQ